MYYKPHSFLSKRDIKQRVFPVPLFTLLLLDGDLNYV